MGIRLSHERHDGPSALLVMRFRLVLAPVTATRLFEEGLLLVEGPVVYYLLGLVNGVINCQSNIGIAKIADTVCICVSLALVTIEPLARHHLLEDTQTAITILRVL